MHKRRLLCMLAIGLAQSKPSSEPRKRAASVPFVSCEAESQMGPLKAPDARPCMHLSLPISQVGSPITNQNRGSASSCRGVGTALGCGSSGYALYVSREPVTASDLLSGGRLNCRPRRI